MLSFIKRLLGRSQKQSPPQRITRHYGSAAIIPRKDHCVSRADISQNALKVLTRLHQANFEAYLVGGGVRDLLVRHAPKDFDVVTSASPEQVRQLFRNCRLIGRRFRLAHIHFGREIVEVATFRARTAPRQHDHHRLRETVDENIFGTMEEDAWRRDISINALYYNNQDFCIIDYTGGYADLQAKVIRIIGDPVQRYQEDPVRILRVIRFTAKLQFTIDPQTSAAIPKTAHLLEDIPSARLFEEVIKLLLSGNAERCLNYLVEFNLLPILFPSLAQCHHVKRDSLIQHLLKNTDQRVHEEKPVTPAFLFAVLLWFPLLNEARIFEKDGLAPLPALEEAMSLILEKQSTKTSIPKRLRKLIREVWILQYRFPKRYGKRPYKVLEHPRFRAGYDFLLLRQQIDDAPLELVEWWLQFQNAQPAARESLIAKLKKQDRPRKKKPQTDPTTDTSNNDEANPT